MQDKLPTRGHLIRKKSHAGCKGGARPVPPLARHAFPSVVSGFLKNSEYSVRSVGHLFLKLFEQETLKSAGAFRPAPSIASHHREFATKRESLERLAGRDVGGEMIVPAVKRVHPPAA